MDTARFNRIILASGSASRRQMLAAAGVACDVIPSNVDEPELRRRLERECGAVAAADLAIALARAKATDVSVAHPDALVIGADQVLALGPRLYEKPKDLNEARMHLLSFRGATHVLHSGVALARAGLPIWAHLDAARMTMRTFSDDFVDGYIQQTGPVICSSVGAYQLEGQGIQLFERIDGDYFTILGMPLLPLLAELRNQKAIPE